MRFSIRHHAKPRKKGCAFYYLLQTPRLRTSARRRGLGAVRQLETTRGRRFAPARLAARAARRPRRRQNPRHLLLQLRGDLGVGRRGPPDVGLRAHRRSAVPAPRLLALNLALDGDLGGRGGVLEPRVEVDLVLREGFSRTVTLYRRSSTPYQSF